MESTIVGNASWAPDGSAIVVASDKENTVLVYIISADGKDEMAVADGGSPSWSPKLASASIQRLGQAPPKPVPSSQSKDTGYLGLFVYYPDGDLMARLKQPERDGLLVP